MGSHFLKIAAVAASSAFLGEIVFDKLTTSPSVGSKPLLELESNTAKTAVKAASIAAVALVLAHLAKA